MNGSRAQQIVQRSRERRDYEDAAQRLSKEFPSLLTLRLEIRESRGVTSPSEHVRHIVVASAPATFDVPCVHRGCNGGSHDITPDVLRGLSQSLGRFQGECSCTGDVGSAYCECTLRFTAVATYAEDEVQGHR